MRKFPSEKNGIFPKLLEKGLTRQFLKWLKNLFNWILRELIVIEVLSLHIDIWGDIMIEPYFKVPCKQFVKP